MGFNNDGVTKIKNQIKKEIIMFLLVEILARIKSHQILKQKMII